MAEKIGAYICSCGTNISENVDVEKVAAEVGKEPGVAVAKTHKLLCSEEGVKFIETEIRENGLERVVVAACSPRQHEKTFQKACGFAGINPYLFQMANIRELCSWITDDPEEATRKSIALTRAAVRRVKFHEPLKALDMECSPDVMVIGAGVAGMSAAMLLAQKGRKVILVEKSPCIGGMTTRYEEVFPNMECATCMLEPRMDEVLHSDRIELMTLSEVDEVLGFFGSFDVKIKKKARYVDVAGCFGCNECIGVCPVNVDNEYNENIDKRAAMYVPYAGALPYVPAIDKKNCLRFKGEECTACADSCGFGAVVFDQEDEIVSRQVGSIIVATGFGLFDCSQLPEFGYKKFDNVITSMELERIISSTGPTDGEVLKKDGNAPQEVSIIHCVGSRDKETCNYCSGVCCMNAMKLAHSLKAKVPDIKVNLLYSDMCLPGDRGQELMDKMLKDGVAFKRVMSPKSIKVSGSNGSLSISYMNAGGVDDSVTSDMVVLSPAIVPGSDTGVLAELLDIDMDSKGFFSKIHAQNEPVSTCLSGVFVAGCAQGPLNVAESAMQGKAAAGEVLSKLIPGEKLELETITAFIDEGACSGCKMCISLCPFKAISFDGDKKVSVVNQVLCRGCGTCVGACPGGAATGNHFSQKQILAEIAGVLK